MKIRQTRFALDDRLCGNSESPSDQLDFRKGLMYEMDRDRTFANG